MRRRKQNAGAQDGAITSNMAIPILADNEHVGCHLPPEFSQVMLHDLFMSCFERVPCQLSGPGLLDIGSTLGHGTA